MRNNIIEERCSVMLAIEDILHRAGIFYGYRQSITREIMSEVDVYIQSLLKHDNPSETLERQQNIIVDDLGNHVGKSPVTSKKAQI